MDAWCQRLCGWTEMKSDLEESAVLAEVQDAGRRWPGPLRGALGWWVEGLTNAEPVLLGRTDSAIRDSPLSSSPARLHRHPQGQQMSCAGKAPDGPGVLCVGTWTHEDTRALLGGRRSESETGGRVPRGEPHCQASCELQLLSRDSSAQRRPLPLTSA